tara:strand:+ start:1091 stop:1279 length:189 start_codon:yes stop_codon:yes gene_type:complete
MFKLILVFGVWINPCKVFNLVESPEDDDCLIVMGSDDYDFIRIEGKTCDQVAQEINKQMATK